MRLSNCNGQVSSAFGLFCFHVRDADRRLRISQFWKVSRVKVRKEFGVSAGATAFVFSEVPNAQRVGLAEAGVVAKAQNGPCNNEAAGSGSGSATKKERSAVVIARRSHRFPVQARSHRQESAYWLFDPDTVWRLPETVAPRRYKFGYRSSV